MGRKVLVGPCLAVLAVALAGCSGSSNSGGSAPGTTTPPPSTGDTGCTGSCATSASFLTAAEVSTIIAQAVAEAQGQNTPATIAVVDRVGNVLGVFRMNGARTQVTISSNRGVSGGLENINIIPSELAAISKAVTGAYLSSEGNAFSTRTASQIVQEHFNPRELGTPGGPLFGVQFSQLLCSDLIQLPAPTLNALGATGNTTVGPKSSPLGLSADPGGFPLYKGGTVVGGIGVVADAQYTLDPNIFDVDRDVDELIATAGTFNFGAPTNRRGDHITADGKTFRYSDVGFSDLNRDPATAAGFASINGSAGALFPVNFYFGGTIVAGTAFTTPASGYVADGGLYAGQDAFILVDTAGNNRFPPRAGTDGSGALTAAEVQSLLTEGLKIANRGRAQIRQPLDSQIRVTLSVVDSNGTVLGVARTRDAPVFGTDVSLQKARTAAFFSGSFAASDLSALPNAIYLNANGTASSTQIRFADYVTATRNFIGDNTLYANNVAWTPRAIGNIGRPFFPDGIDGRNNGPLSKPFASWSPFADGIQLDLVYNAIGSILTGYLTNNAAPIVALRPATEGGGAQGCAVNPRLYNGIQIFPGASPIFRNGRVVGALGISGDGIDQDDMIGFLGVYNAGQAANTGFGHAPLSQRVDQYVPQGARLRYVQCPQAPFLNSTEQNVCEGK